MGFIDELGDIEARPNAHGQDGQVSQAGSATDGRLRCPRSLEIPSSAVGRYQEMPTRTKRTSRVRLVGTCVVALLLSGCASTSQLMSYGVELSDALVTVDGRRFTVYVHPRDDTLLLQPKMGAGFLPNGEEPIYTWRKVAEQFVAPVGCGISAVKFLTSASWEANYVCPAGVDLRGLVVAQRAQLQQGAPLHR